MNPLYLVAKYFMENTPYHVYTYSDGWRSLSNSLETLGSCDTVVVTKDKPERAIIKHADLFMKYGSMTIEERGGSLCIVRGGPFEMWEGWMRRRVRSQDPNMIKIELADPECFDKLRRVVVDWLETIPK